MCICVICACICVHVCLCVFVSGHVHMLYMHGVYTYVHMGVYGCVVVYVYSVDVYGYVDVSDFICIG